MMNEMITNLLKEQGQEMVATMFAHGMKDDIVMNCVVNGVVNSNHPQKEEMLTWLFK